MKNKEKTKEEEKNMKNIEEMSDVELFEYMGENPVKWAEVFMASIVNENKKIDNKLLEMYFSLALRTGYDLGYDSGQKT